MINELINMHGYSLKAKEKVTYLLNDSKIKVKILPTNF